MIQQPMLNGAYRLVLNEYMSKISDKIIKDQEERNHIIEATYWFNPVTGFHNWLNQLTDTGHQANLSFRRKIKEGGKTINHRLVLDEWSEITLDKKRFEEYIKLLTSN